MNLHCFTNQVSEYEPLWETHRPRPVLVLLWPATGCSRNEGRYMVRNLDDRNRERGNHFICVKKSKAENMWHAFSWNHCFQELKAQCESMDCKKTVSWRLLLLWEWHTGHSSEDVREKYISAANKRRLREKSVHEKISISLHKGINQKKTLPKLAHLPSITCLLWARGLGFLIIHLFITPD